MRPLVHKPLIIVTLVMAAALGSLVTIPHIKSAPALQGEKKVTGSGVDSMLIEYDFDTTQQPGVFTPVAGTPTRERAAGSKIKTIQVFDANERLIHTETCQQPNRACTVVLGTSGNQNVTIADDPQGGITLDYERSRFKQGRAKKWRIACSAQLQRVTVQTSAAQAPTFRQNCANNKCTVEVTYTF